MNKVIIYSVIIIVSLSGIGLYQLYPIIESENCFGNSVLEPIINNYTIALIRPVLTSTPYSLHSSNSFYAFYAKYKNATGNIYSDLNLLNTNVSQGLQTNSGFGVSYPLLQFLESDTAKSCGIKYTIINDYKIPNTNLTRYNILIIPFSEYVTSQEYLQYENYVSTGGKIILTGSDNFQVLVKYNATTGIETLVLGHGFAYNGVYAIKNIFDPLRTNNTNWIGSNLCCFKNISYSGGLVNTNTTIGNNLKSKFGNTVFTQYTAHEENSISNFTNTTIIVTMKSNPLIASYQHKYGKGLVTCFCIMGNDVINNDLTMQYFLVLSMVY